MSSCEVTDRYNFISRIYAINAARMMQRPFALFHLHVRTALYEINEQRKSSEQQRQ